MSYGDTETDAASDRDRQRLYLEERSVSRQAQQLFIEQWRLGVQTAENRAQETANAAVQAGQQGLRTLAFVNAGALIGLPSFAKGFSGASISASNLVPAISGFVVGLSLTLLAMLFAYTANFCSASSHFREGQIRAIELNVKHTEDSAEERNDHHRIMEEKKWFNKYARRSQFASVGFAIFSILAFIFGAVSGLYVVA